MPQHVSSNKCSSSGGSTCINTSSGIIHSGWRLADGPVRSFLLTGPSDSHQSVLYQMMYWYKLILLLMSTCCSKHVQAWNKYIEKGCVKLVINQNYNHIQFIVTNSFILIIKNLDITFFHLRQNISNTCKKNRDSDPQSVLLPATIKCQSINIIK